MIPGPHPRDADAFEFALGTLSGEERRAFERDLARDLDLRASLLSWENRLAGLAEAVPPEQPSAGLLDRVQARLGASDAVASGPIDMAAFARLRRSRTVWRGIAAGAGSLAAALALWVAAGLFPASRPESGLVAVVNRAGDLPALIVRVDTRSGIVQVRSVAAEAPAGRALELWSVAGGGAPRSLGLIGGGLTRAALSRESSLSEGVTLAVSVEPPGGSPTGSPTGPVVYSGRLIPETP